MMNRQKNLSNELVRLKPMEESDFNAVWGIAQDCEIWEQHNAKERCEEDGFRKFFKQSLESGGAQVIIALEENKVIGSSRFELLPQAPDWIEIGWTFFEKERWGGPWNRSVKTLMLDYALQYFDRVLFVVWENNFRSQKAVQKLGAVELPESLMHLFSDKVDHKVYWLSAEQWERNKG